MNNDNLLFFKIPSLIAISQYIWFSGNNSLMSIDLSSLQSNTLQAGLTISVNKNLPNLIGFEKLEYINGDLTIKTNDNLSSLEGLNSLRKVRDLTILSNPKLNNISALKNIQSVNKLYIRNNLSLPIDDVDTLIEQIGLENIELVIHTH